MENASKALIIAGAILLSILLISLGVMIFTQARTAISGSGMTDAEVTAFNEKFTKYEGKRRGSEIRAMVQEVMANNNSADASDETRVSINASNRNENIDSADADDQLVKLEAGASKSPSYGTSSGHEFNNTTTYTVTPKYKDGKVAILQVKKK